jgi:hypothetical protein
MLGFACSSIQASPRPGRPAPIHNRRTACHAGDARLAKLHITICVAMPCPGLRRIEYEASTFGAELATETINSIRHRRDGVKGLLGRPTGHRQADSDLLLC